MTHIRLALLAGLVATPLGAAPNDKVEAGLKHKAFSKWSIVTPVESWKPLTGKIAIPFAAGGGFLAHPENSAIVLMVDTNQDGKVDAKIKGLGGSAKLRGKTTDGKSFEYGVRFRKKGKAWQYSAGGAMIGKLHGTKIQLIDLNNNGTYNDFGADAMIVGKSKSAGFLSKVVNIGNKLYKFDTTADGSTMSAEPFTGETGTIDVRRGFASKGRLDCAVVKHASEPYYFNVVQSKTAMTVPAGEYRFAGGVASKGKEIARIGAGKMQPLAVKTGASAKLTWGGPVVADFTFARFDGDVKVQPNVRYYGKAGEEYHSWVPDNTSPKIFVFDSRKKRPVASGRFGSC